LFQLLKVSVMEILYLFCAWHNCLWASNVSEEGNQTSFDQSISPSSSEEDWTMLKYENDAILLMENNLAQNTSNFYNVSLRRFMKSQ
jgi:hypothetical protein